MLTRSFSNTCRYRIRDTCNQKWMIWLNFLNKAHSFDSYRIAGEHRRLDFQLRQLELVAGLHEVPHRVCGVACC